MSPITNCFWKTVKPFLSDKGPMKQKITLIIENDENIGNNKEISKIFNNFSRV